MKFDFNPRFALVFIFIKFTRPLKWIERNFKIFSSQLRDVACIVRMLTTNVLLYLAVNLAGMYTKYLTDRGQRQAFLETHRSTETRQRTQNENNRQEKLLLSGKKSKKKY